jgi:hypothetical protein
MFAYLLPQSDPISPSNPLRSVLTRYGLGDVLRDLVKTPDHAITQRASAAIDNRPAGQFVVPVPVHGTLPNDLSGSAEYWDAEPVWSDAPAMAWICWPRDEARQPQPADLERRSQVNGYLVPDSRGQRWRWPAVRGHSNFPAPYGGLPGEFTFDSQGTAHLVLAPDYQQLWALTGRVWDYLTDSLPIGSPITQLELAQIAAGALEVNYRVGPIELAIMQRLGRAVINTNNLQVVLQSICDIDSVEAYLREKKTDASRTACAGQGSTPGSTGATPSGNRPEENCG